jgi:hypothetical protein
VPQVLTAGGLLRLSSALRELGCTLALLQILDTAAGLEASRAAVFAVPLFQAFNESHSATAMQVGSSSFIFALVVCFKPFYWK